jgi:hypothetical protein
MIESHGDAHQEAGRRRTAQCLGPLRRLDADVSPELASNRGREPGDFLKECRNDCR